MTIFKLRNAVKYLSEGNYSDIFRLGLIPYISESYPEQLVSKPLIKLALCIRVKAFRLRSISMNSGLTW